MTRILRHVYTAPLFPFFSLTAAANAIMMPGSTLAYLFCFRRFWLLITTA